MRFDFPAFVAVVALATGSHAASIPWTRADLLISCLESSLSPDGSVVLPNDPVFQNITGRYSELYGPSFGVVSEVANEHDVRASIDCATRTNTTFLITGPRHGFYSGFDELNNGLEIYTGAFDDVTIDLEANTMTCGGAAEFQKVIDVAWAENKIIPTGSAPCVGMVGVSLGAGIGRLEGLYGLITDNLLSVRIMLPNTTVVEASTEVNPDLFWGIRGAGWNFGFVLNATFQVHDQAADGLHMVADFIYPSNITEAFYQRLKEEAEHMPAPLAIASGLFWNPDYNETTLTINAVYAGPECEGRKAIQFLLDQSPILRQRIIMAPWNRVIQSSFFGSGVDLGENDPSCIKPGGRRSIFTSAFNEFDPAAQAKMTEMFNYMVNTYPQTSQSVAGLYFPATQAARAVPDNATAYPWRRVLGHMTFSILYSDEISTDTTVENLPLQMRNTISETAGTDGLQAYVGFSHGDEPLESIFSKGNLPRLAELKREYDPHGLFNAYHPLPTSYP